jgi:GDP-mannose 6-dehydrogenase
MKISIFGLGYVGCVSAVCLARDGHTVIGVDVNPYKVELLQKGQSPISEPGLDALLAENVANGSLRATLDAHQAVLESEISLICVGTPSNHNGQINFQYIETVCHEIGSALMYKPGHHIVVVRSTVLPGTVLNRLVPIIEQSSQKCLGADFGVCMNPEFMREGSAIADYDDPGIILIGESDQRSGFMVEIMYGALHASVTHTQIPVAEMAKYVSNSFHALKVVFANEIGSLCKAQGINGQEVMSIFCQDRRLNISTKYFKPGFAYGGSCLPKDVRALTHRAKEMDVEVPLLNALAVSNQLQVQRAIEMVEETGLHRVGVLGLSFKPSTDDVRESPTVSLLETLYGRGYEISVYDEIVVPEKLIGANRAFLERELPHIASAMRTSIEDVLYEADVIVIANSSPKFSSVVDRMRSDQVLIDLVGIAQGETRKEVCYEGIAW